MTDELVELIRLALVGPLDMPADDIDDAYPQSVVAALLANPAEVLRALGFEKTDEDAMSEMWERAK